MDYNFLEIVTIAVLMEMELFPPSGKPNAVLLAIVALSAVQSFVQILTHNAILFINTSAMFGTTKVIG